MDTMKHERHSELRLLCLTSAATPTSHELPRYLLLTTAPNRCTAPMPKLTPTASYPDLKRPIGAQRTLPILIPPISNIRRPSPTPTSPPPTPAPTEPWMRSATERRPVTDEKSPPQPRQLPRQVPYQSNPQPLPRPPPHHPLACKRPRCIGDNRYRGRRAPARCGITPSRTPQHYAAASTPRTTACLTALSRQPLLTLPAAPPCRSPKPRAPRAPREPQWTPPWHTVATAQAGAARAPRRPPRKHCLPLTPLTSRYTP